MKSAGSPPFVIKICGITNPEDARVAIEAGANALGFNFYRKSPRYVTPEAASEIISEVAGAYLKVGVFVNSEAAEICRLAASVPLDVAQLYGKGPVKKLCCDAWRAGTVADVDPTPDDVFDAYLLDAPSENFGGAGKSFDWRLAAGFPYRAIIAGGLDHANVGEAIRVALPWGVDACSKLESSPGKKDRARVRNFIQAAIEARNRYMQETTS